MIKNIKKESAFYQKWIVCGTFNISYKEQTLR